MNRKTEGVAKLVGFFIHSIAVDALSKTVCPNFKSLFKNINFWMDMKSTL